MDQEDPYPVIYEPNTRQWIVITRPQNAQPMLMSKGYFHPTETRFEYVEAGDISEAFEYAQAHLQEGHLIVGLYLPSNSPGSRGELYEWPHATCYCGVIGRLHGYE